MSDNLKGGEFLIKESTSTFVPEEFNEEQKMIAQMCKDFVAQEVTPNLDRIDSMEDGLMESILDKAGELGLLSMSIPEELGGMGASFVTSMIATEYTGHAHSAAVAMSAHSGIGTLPILYFGNQAQKEKYIPKLATGELKACYCLTEPGAGSDANSGKTKAVLDGDNYIINGQKMWITNSGFADVFVVFAKIDNDDNLSAFIVEKGYEGLSLNPEEKKMGIKGSSTRQVFFNNCKVPAENLLGQRGEGFKIALNILNIGRLKLAGATLGASKEVIGHSVQYAGEREQFGRPIAKYGAIKNKIGEQIIRTFAAESALYRVCNNIDGLISELIESGKTKEEATLSAIYEYAAEAAILKVYGSESLDFVVDEGVQIYGGMGYSAESPVERAYRDSRINRIFEGTNEINRQLSVDFLLKKAMKGKLDLMGPAQKVAGELMSIPDMNEPEGVFGVAENYIANYKKAILMVAGAAVQKLMMSLAKEQEVLMGIADMMIETYVAESILLRVKKIYEITGKRPALEEVIMNAYLYDASDRINKSAKDALNSFAEGDELRMMLMGLKRFTKHEMYNIKDAKRVIADSRIKTTQPV